MWKKFLGALCALIVSTAAHAVEYYSTKPDRARGMVTGLNTATIAPLCNWLKRHEPEVNAPYGCVSGYYQGGIEGRYFAGSEVDLSRYRPTPRDVLTLTLPESKTYPLFHTHGRRVAVNLESAAPAARAAAGSGKDTPRGSIQKPKPLAPAAKVTTQTPTATTSTTTQAPAIPSPTASTTTQTVVTPSQGSTTVTATTPAAPTLPPVQVPTLGPTTDGELAAIRAEKNSLENELKAARADLQEISGKRNEVLRENGDLRRKIAKAELDAQFARQGLKAIRDNQSVFEKHFWGIIAGAVVIALAGFYLLARVLRDKTGVKKKELQKNLEASQAQVTQLQGEVTNLKTKVASLTTQPKNGETLEVRHEKALARVRALERENENLKKRTVTPTNSGPVVTAKNLVPGRVFENNGTEEYEIFVGHVGGTQLFVMSRSPIAEFTSSDSLVADDENYILNHLSDEGVQNALEDMFQKKLRKPQGSTVHTN